MPRSLTWMPAGPRMTANSTGKKNRIIGTVSFGRQCSRLLLGGVHALVAAFIGQHAQRVGDRRAVAFGLNQRLRDGSYRFEPGAGGEIVIGGLAVLKEGELGVGQHELFGKFHRLDADLFGDLAYCRIRLPCRIRRRSA